MDYLKMAAKPIKVKNSFLHNTSTILKSSIIFNWIWITKIDQRMFFEVNNTFGVLSSFFEYRLRDKLKRQSSWNERLCALPAVQFLSVPSQVQEFAINQFLSLDPEVLAISLQAEIDKV